MSLLKPNSAFSFTCWSNRQGLGQQPEVMNEQLFVNTLVKTDVGSVSVVWVRLELSQGQSHNIFLFPPWDWKDATGLPETNISKKAALTRAHGCLVTLLSKTPLSLPQEHAAFYWATWRPQERPEGRSTLSPWTEMCATCQCESKQLPEEAGNASELFSEGLGFATSRKHLPFALSSSSCCD